LAKIVNVSFGQSFLSTQQIQVALQAHETYDFVITPQVGDNSTSGAPGVSIEFTPLFSETTTTASNLNTASSSTINPSTSGNSTTPAAGLQLGIDVNTTQIQYGQGLSANIDLFNTNSKNLTLGVNYTASDQNILAWNDRDYFCGGNPVVDLFGFAVYQGDYSARNISQAPDPLPLHPSTPLSCFNSYYYEPYISQAVFLPRSNTVDIISNNDSGSTFDRLSLSMVMNATTGICENQSYNQSGTTTVKGNVSTYTTEVSSFSCGSENGLYGFWTPPINQSCDAQSMINASLVNSSSGEPLYCHLGPFPVGTYTIRAQDLWNQTVFAYFQVVPSSETTTTTTAVCPNNYPNGTDDGTTLFLSQSSASGVNLCVKYYYYNSTATATIQTLRQLTIYAPVLSNSSGLRNADSMFSISASASQFQIGGPQSENEGFEVDYRIITNGTIPSGTYEIGFSSALYPRDIICGWGIYLDLQVGNTTNATVGTTCHVAQNPENNPGLVYTEFVGLTNST